MKISSLGLGFLALTACQSGPPEAPLLPEEAFAEVRFEFDT